LDTVKTTYIVIATIFVCLTLLLSVGFYYTVLEYKICERRFEVMSLTVRLNIDLKNLYREDIRQADLANTSDEEKVLALNAIIQPLFDEISKQYPNYGIGYYDKRFDSIAAKAPDFKASMLQHLTKSDPCFISYESGKLELVENSTSVGWNRKGIISVTLPFSVNNIMIGHVWANIKTDDVYQSVFEYSIGVLGFFSVLFFIPYTVTRFIIRKLRIQLSSFAESILEDDGVQIDTRILPELNPLLTAAKAHSQQLRTYEAMVQNSTDSICTIDLDFKITSFNLAAQRMYGYTAKEVLGREINLIAVPEGFQKMKEDFERIKSGEEVLTRDVQRQKKDGKAIDVSLSLSPIRDDQGLIIGIMGIHRDITERKQMEAEMKRLDGLNLIGQMAASIAHEIRNPMTTVRGFLQLLGSKPNLLNYKNYFMLMIEELDRANSIITEFLSLSRNTPIELNLQNLNTIFNKLLPMLQADALKNEHIIVVELEEIPNFELNEQEIRQVILNLVRNGFESMAAGGVITIKTYLENDQAVIAVSDQGSGIPPEVLKNIGKPFLTTKDNGTGLGLAVSYNIVHRHGGTINIETGTEGTTFVIKLPLKRTLES
jgi:PAS domain S-box-containing protein